MKIKFKEHFADRLDNHVEYIAIESIEQAKKYKTELINLINQIPLNPYQYQKSIFVEDDNIRELIYKGNSIVFRITDSAIEIFGIVKHQDLSNDDLT